MPRVLVCAWCASRARGGVVRDGPGSAPLCRRCWRGREQRRARAEQDELERLLWEAAARVDAAVAAETAETAGTVGPACAACGEMEASPACWLCGYAWLH